MTTRTLSQKARRRRKIDSQFPDLVNPKMPWRYDPEASDDDIADLMYHVLPFGGLRSLSHLEQLCFFPGDRELPEEGGWVWVIRPPHSTFDLAFGGVYFAVPYKDGAPFGWRDRKFSVTVHAPEGEMRLWPYEYAVPKVEEIVEWWQDGAFAFHLFDNVGEQDMTDRLFYVTSRGIPMAEAMPMVLGEMKTPIGWFELLEKGGLSDR